MSDLPPVTAGSGIAFFPMTVVNFLVAVATPRLTRRTTPVGLGRDVGLYGANARARQALRK